MMVWMKKYTCNLPEEVVEKILLRLPPKPLIRFKSVCKSWNSLINEEYFVKKHVETSIKKSKNRDSSSASLVLGWTRYQPVSIGEIYYGGPADDIYNYDPDLGRKQVLSLVSIVCNNNNNNDHYIIPSVVEEIYLPLIPDVEIHGIGFLTPIKGSHCNGIICLVDLSPSIRERVVFYNPALREHKLVHTKRYNKPDFEYVYCTHGFGYDSKANDYKFVRIVNNYAQYSYKAEIYTLGSDSWKYIEIKLINERIDVIEYEGVYLEGFIYWMFLKSIVAFDICEEKVSSISRPNIEEADEFIINKVGVWKGLLVCFSIKEECRYSKCYGMWVMTPNNIWTKYLTIGPLKDVICCPMMFWNEEEILMETRDGRIVSYNIRTRTLRKLPIRGAILIGQTYADFYIQTLVSFNSTN